MSPDWAYAQRLYKRVVGQNGVWIQWLQRVVSGSGAYDYENTTTYGYGDDTRYWVTGSCQAIIEHVKATDVIIPSGFFIEDFERIWVNPDINIEYFEQIIYPSGSNIRYLILPIHAWSFNVGGATGSLITGSKSALIRRLLPRSGSVW